MSGLYQNPDFDYWDIDYDISVLELASELSFGSAIASIGLPVQDQEFEEGELSVVTGWGTTTEGGSLPSQLQAVEVPLVSLAACRAAYGTAAVTDRMICAGFTEGGRDACQVYFYFLMSSLLYYKRAASAVFCCRRANFVHRCLSLERPNRSK